MSQELTTTTKQSELTILSPDVIHAQIQAVQELMKSEMKEGLDGHYAKIPGCGDKKVLLKAGAEKLNLLFRLAAHFQITIRDVPGHPGHREYEVITTLTQINTGQVWGQGVGCCSTMESKYRYRESQELEDTGMLVPKEYWDLRKYDPKQAQEMIGGHGYVTKKVDNTWMIFKKTGDGQRVENPDIADTYNTVLKMAKKRSHVDAVITATATSDIFTQDLDETIPLDITNAPKEPPAPPKETPKQASPPVQTSASTSAPTKELIRELDLMCAIFAKNAGLSLVEWKKQNLRGMSFDEANELVTKMYENYYSDKARQAREALLTEMPPQVTDGIFSEAK